MAVSRTLLAWMKPIKDWVGKLPTGGTTGQVLTKTSGADHDLEWATVVSGDAAVATHEAAPDPHPGYLTQSEGEALFEPIGTAAAELTDHEAAADPHPGYLTAAEGNAAYAAAGHSHVGAAPTGGATGQVLKKNSNTNYDYDWTDDEQGAGGPAFPVGSVFLSVVSTDPATLLGYGTWSQIAGGRVLVGQAAGDADFDTAEEVGGSKTSTALLAHTHGVTDPGHTHVQDSHNHTQDAHTHTQNAHQHGMAEGTTDGSGTFMDRSNAAAATTAVTDAATAVNQNATATNQAATAVNQAAATGITDTDSAGSGASFSLMNPYFVVYIWKRTA